MNAIKDELSLCWKSMQAVDGHWHTLIDVPRHFYWVWLHQFNSELVKRRSGGSDWTNYWSYCSQLRQRQHALRLFELFHGKNNNVNKALYTHPLSYAYAHLLWWNCSGGHKTTIKPLIHEAGHHDSSSSTYTVYDLMLSVGLEEIQIPFEASVAEKKVKYAVLSKLFFL